MKAIIVISAQSLPLAQTIRRQLDDAVVYSRHEMEGCTPLADYHSFMEQHFHDFSHIVFIGAMGICVRTIAPFLTDKHTDPAVVCIDSTGRFVIPVVSGHVGGANELARQLASAIEGEAIVTTQSDNEGLWALDRFEQLYGWKCECLDHASMNAAIARFVARNPTALLLEINDKGTRELERTRPEHVQIFYHFDDLHPADFEQLITVSPRIYRTTVPTLRFFPPVLHLGIGCRKQCASNGVAPYIVEQLTADGYSPLALASIATIELKKDEPVVGSLHEAMPHAETRIYRAEELEEIEVPHPSDKVFQTTGVYGVAEACALKSAHCGELLIGKTKACLTEGNQFTFALAHDAQSLRKGHIEIVGAGPGDPELISMRGRAFLEQADLILYAGSLVPRELTHCAKPGATVRSSADMNLEEQFALMKSFYDKGLLTVRLHTGDPCIYGAIQEQMALFDAHHMRYHITPGISSFQAAAAALRSQFTIPEKVQSIILTRGEGRTPMPEREQLHKLAQSRSTMCIYLSAGIVDKIQEELLTAYPPETPAACYKLTWKEEKIYRGKLCELADIVKRNHLTLTTLLVVGDAIDNREGLSRLYADEFKHLFRK